MLRVWGSFNVFFVQQILILVFCTIKVEETKNKIQKQKNKQTNKKTRYALKNSITSLHLLNFWWYQI